jgi:carboxyl-terminal processing protease
MKILTKTISSTLLVFLFWTLTPVLPPASATEAAAAAASLPLAPKPYQSKILGAVLNHLRLRHYRKISLDDEMSSKIFYRYIDELDPSHSFLYNSDIRGYELVYRFNLDEKLQKKDLGPAFKIFNRYQERVIEQLSAMVAAIDKGFADMDLTVEENERIDRKDIPWPNSQVAMEELWRKRLKGNVINLKLAGKTDSEIQETLGRRYRNQLKRARQSSSDDAFELFINGVTLSADPHTQYFSPHRSENFNINMSLSLEGIGAVLMNEDEYTKVTRLIPGGPAERSKLLQAGDRIVGVSQGEDGEMIDILGWRLDEVVNIIRGPKGTLVRLEIIPADAVDIHETRVISIVRDKVKLEDQAAKKEVIEVMRDGRLHKIGLIDIPTFYADFKGMHEGKRNYRSTTKDVKKLLFQLKKEGVEGVIIDLRDNGGGSLQEVNKLVGLFVALGATVQVKNADGRIDIIRDHDPTIVYSGPIIVLVNRMSASASEIFAGAIQDYRRGLIMGEQTFGKGTVQSLLDLSKGQLKATTAKYYRISGNSTQHKGVEPDLYYPSLHSVALIGENTLPEALAWDRINPIPYQVYYPLDSILPQLQQSHNRRNKASMDFQYILDRRARNAAMTKKKEISLSLATRKRERQEADKWRLEKENLLRQSRGEFPLEDIGALKEEAGANPHDSTLDVTDPLVIEAGETMVDLIGLL